MFSSIIDARIRTVVVQNLRQKGFTSSNGCAQNSALLDNALSNCKFNRGGVFTILDISKAFDTVPHKMIEIGLNKRGIPPRLIELIKNIYKNSFTNIKARNNENVKIEIKRGVKQGDSLSPLLFNLSLEPLLEELEENTTGLPISDNTHIAVLAFADDLVLLSKDEEEAQIQLNLVMSYLRKLGMSISASKCNTFHIMTKKDTWFVKDPELITDDGKAIPSADPAEVLRYLGSKIGPWKGMECGIVVPEIIHMIKKIKTFPLKPQQKIDLLTTYILPRFIYQLLISPPSDGVLKLLDSELRQQVKDILHLVPPTTKAFFYTAKRKGGLGFPRFEHIIK